MQDNTVYVVDDDLAVRNALKRSLKKHHYGVETFITADDFLREYCSSDHPRVPACLVLDVRMPGMTGLELQEELAQRSIFLPIIFVTGHGDIPMSVRAMKEGAIDFLEKPYPVKLLLERIEEAIRLSTEKHEQDAKDAVIKARFELLTQRECDVFELLVAGAANTSNKVIARELSISHRTVDDHRAKIMAKMQARSVSELVDMAKICGVYRSGT